MRYSAIFILAGVFIACQGQTPSDQVTKRLVGGPCEGCEAVFEGTATSNSDTLPGFHSGAPQLLLKGTVKNLDGQPAENVVVYAYHTNQEGIYPTRESDTGWGRRHGFIRGWVRTNADGYFAFYTTRPAGYPKSSAPQHIHLLVLEPDGRYYYIDAIHFTDDERLTSSMTGKMECRGGNGVVTPELKNGMWVVTRDITLGQNIPDY